MLFFVIFALFYNLSAKIKGDLHFGMEEIVTDEIKTI
jgi:hypothetical protein